MTDYMTQEAMFEVPPELVDATINVLHPADKRTPKILVSRVPASGTLDAWVAYQTKDVTQRTPWFTPVSTFDATVEGLPGRGLRATFREDDLDLYQTRLTFQHAGKFLTIVVVGEVATSAECDAMLDRVVASIRLRKE